MTPDPKDRDSKEQRALDALLAQALRSVDESKFPKADGPAPTLEPDDERALQALGPDLVQRIMAGSVPPAKKSASPRPRRSSSPELAGAMNRGGDEEGELTDEARDEIERKIREIEAAEGRVDEDQDEPPDGPS